MFEDLHDLFLRVGSWRWPLAQGEITDVDFMHMPGINSAGEVTLSVAYRFSVNGDGPYTGIREWTSTHYRIGDLQAART